MSREGNGQTGHRMLTANRIRLAAGSKPGITDSDEEDDDEAQGVWTRAI